MVLEYFNILSIVLLILVIFPLIIYLIWGLSPKIKYDKKVNYKAPNNDPPALVNFLFSGGINNNFDEINIGSFYLTLLDLINRKYISVRIVSKKYRVDNNTKESIFHNKDDFEDKKVLDKIILKIKKQHIEELHLFEKNVLRCLATLENKGNIDILSTKELLYKRLKVSTFQKNYDAWMKNFYDEFFKDNKANFFKNKFEKVFEVYGLFLLIIFIFSAVFSYLESSYLNLIFSFIVGILGLYLIVSPFNLGEWTKEGKKLKIKWDLFKKYYNENLKNSNHSQEFLDEGINYLPYLLALRISKPSLLNNLSESNNITDAYLFLKYVEYPLIKNIVKDFLAADGSFDPKYYNTSGNFVPGYG